MQKRLLHWLALAAFAAVFIDSSTAGDRPAARGEIQMAPAARAPGQSETADAGEGANGPMRAPVLGYVAAPGLRELRAIIGVPGSAAFSDPLPLPRDVALARLAPGQAYALAERRGGDPAVMLLDGGAVRSATPIAGAIRRADIVAFSPRGQSVVLYSTAAGRLQVLSGLPGSPRIATDVDAGGFSQAPAGAAVSDDGGSVLLIAAGAASRLLPGGFQQPVVRVADSAAAAFLPNSSQAAIADRDAGSVYLWTAEGPTALLATGLGGIGEVRATADGQGFWVADPEGKSVRWIGAQTGEVRAFPLPVSPVQMEFLPHRDMLLISSEAGEPAWIFFQEGSEARAVFVPAAAPKRRGVNRRLER